jgi:hypothetical protein
LPPLDTHATLGRMSLARAFSSVILLSSICAGCSEPATQLGPSPLLQLGGTYTLTVTTCALPAMNDLENRLDGPYHSIWTITQQDDTITGNYSTSAPPSVSFGTLTGRVNASGRVTIDSLQFSWSSSHVGLLKFSAAGAGTADRTRISGSVSGEKSFRALFGGVGSGDLQTCTGTGMPFRLTKAA